MRIIILTIVFLMLATCAIAQENNHFGLAFDAEVRYSQLLDQIGDADIDPVWSILTPGLGYVTYRGEGDEFPQLLGETEKKAIFRIGVRPEIVVSPHDQEDDYGNSISFSEVIPEFLMEYQKDKFVLGVSYKNYRIKEDYADGYDEDIADLHTFSLYAKCRGFVFGYNFVDIDEDQDFMSDISKGSSFILGFSSSF